MPKAIKEWSLRRVQVKLIKIGARLVRHARRLVFQFVEVAGSQEVFRQVLERIDGHHPAPGQCLSSKSGAESPTLNVSVWFRLIAATAPRARRPRVGKARLAAVTFKVKDTNAAKKYLKRLFIRTEDRRDGFIIRLEEAFGTVIGFTERTIPNDPGE